MNSTVSTNTDVTIDIFRQNSGQIWLTNQCFELYVSSPYLDPKVYSTFLTTLPPVCSSITDGVTVNCNIKVGQPDTLQFFYSSLTQNASSNQQIRLKFANFQTPYSAQLISTINLRSYSDKLCTQNLKAVSIPGLTIQQGITPVSQISLSSSDKTLGSTSATNTLSIKFMPKTTMDPSGVGQIQIGLPMWYQIGGTGEFMYSSSAINKCNSTCMRVTNSSLIGSSLTIFYDQMLSTCISKQYIVVQCQRFQNPITPTTWSGFSLTIYDGSLTNSRIIESTVDTLSFDASQYLPMQMPQNSLTIDPSNTTISTFSTWTLSLSVNIPLMTDCWIKIFLPVDLNYTIRSNMIAGGIFIRPDQSTTLTDQDLNIVLKTSDGSIPKSSVTFHGCNYQPALGKSPFGRLDISSIQTQNAIKDSDSFQISIYKDQNLTQLIAVLQNGVIIPGSSLTPGSISNIKIFPDDQRVQRITNITISFTISHKLLNAAKIEIILPQGLTLPSVGSNLIVKSAGINFQNATVVPGNILQLFLSDVSILENTEIILIVSGITNQNSVRDAGSFQITTFNLYNQFDIVDQQNLTQSYTATTGQVYNIGKMQISNFTNFARASIYTMNFNLEDTLPKAGYISITVPQEVSFSPSTTQSSGSCKIYTCISANTSTVIILMQQGLAAKTQISLDIGGIINPRSFAPTGPFVITSLDTDAESQIDQGYLQTATMSIAGSIQSFSAQQSSFVNGQVNTYTFGVQASIPVQPGDKLTFNLPQEISLDQQINCTGLVNLINLTCSSSGQVITVQFNYFNSSTGSFSWAISGIRNPISTQTSSVFTNIAFMDKNNYLVQNSKSLQTITNKYPGQIIQYSIAQDSKKTKSITNYYITFYPNNPLATTGSIQLTYPQQITLINGSQTQCSVTTTFGSFSLCVIDNTKRTITIQNLFQNQTQPYLSSIQISLFQVQNANNNKPGNGFVIQTYTDYSQTYIVDKLNDFILTPLFECNYPCQTCDPKDPNNCLLCWTNFDDPQYLMTYPNQTSSCRSFCDPGYTTNGDLQQHCTACDPSCSTCVDNQQNGDKFKCIDCSASFQFRLSMTQTCLASCKLGMYQSTNTSCSQCKEPCLGCVESESNCTQCNPNSLEASQLFGKQCIKECPLGYTSIQNVCQKCKVPCAKCSGLFDSCDSCDISGPTKYLFKKSCYSECPVGSVQQTESFSCFQCDPGCDLCDINNQTQCLRCSKPKLAYQGDCISQCPKGQHVNADSSACRPWQLGDLGTLPYPFLIIAGFCTLVCLFGMLKREPYLSNKKIAWRSPQNTLTCIIVVIAPLQFLATIAQWILSYAYGTITFCILAGLVTLAAVILNVAFYIMFIKKFDSQSLPLEIDRKVRLDKLKQEDSKKFLVPSDKAYNNYKMKNKCTVYTIYIFEVLLNYKINKLYYSVFYNLSRFKSDFSQAKKYRKLQTWFSIVYIVCVDLTLICIDITALTQIDNGNQLFITLIETLVLSAISLILASIELYRLKNNLNYTTPRKDKSKLKLSKGIESEVSDDQNLDKKFDKKKMAERRKIMDSLLKQVKQNKQLFLNNKLDELIQSFGDRKCKSMMDLQRPLEDDPQERMTWPISPRLQDEIFEMNFEFKQSDAYNVNNVLASARNKTRAASQQHGIDQQVLQRKNKQFPQGFKDQEERRPQKSRKRGRKNKFHSQIDQEDKQDLEDINDSSIMQTNQEQLRKTIQSDYKYQQDQADTRKKLLKEENLLNQKKQLLAAELRQNEQIVPEVTQIQQQISTEQKNRDIAAKKLMQEQSRKDQLIKHQLIKENAAQSLFAKKQAAEQKLIEAKQKKNNSNTKIQQSEQTTQAELRSFNINDILGDLDRDDKGNVIILNKNKDKKGNLINQRGYLLSKEGVIDQNKNLLFKLKDLDENGELPYPFNLELLNFNPHQCMGDFSYKNGQPEILETQKGYVDKRGRIVNKFGWLVQKDGHIVDFNGNKKFDCKQLTADGNMHKLYNYEGKRFDIQDLLGNFEKDMSGNLLFRGNQDLLGRQCNEKGYLIDSDKNIIDQNDVVIWKNNHLKNGEFQKIFPFTKFNLKKILGDFEGNPILERKQNQLVDSQGRLVNRHGYLLDRQGNIVDSKGQKVFDKCVLDEDENIPAVFRTGLLKTETNSSLSKLMSEIERNHLQKLHDYGETSLDSQMEDTPANYNVANQRLSHNDKKIKNIMVLQASEREKEVAGVYGGKALPSLQRPGVKYDKERLEGRMKFRVNADDQSQVRAQLHNLIKSGIDPTQSQNDLSSIINLDNFSLNSPKHDQKSRELSRSSI